jgi:hypothetical protein
MFRMSAAIVSQLSGIEPERQKIHSPAERNMASEIGLKSTNRGCGHLSRNPNLPVEPQNAGQRHE